MIFGSLELAENHFFSFEPANQQKSSKNPVVKKTITISRDLATSSNNYHFFVFEC
jgi:hypothetical protein